MEQPIEISRSRMPLIEVQKETKTELLRFTQSDRSSLFYVCVIQGRLVRPRASVNESRRTRRYSQLLACEWFDSS